MRILLFCSSFLLYLELTVLFVHLFLVWVDLILRLAVSFCVVRKVFQKFQNF